MERLMPIIFNGEKTNYFISSLGHAISYAHKEKNILKATIDKKGYLRLRLSHKNNKFSKRIHRLVAEYFLCNSYNLPEVNHKDGDKLNNKLENLEWVTTLDNIRHAYKNGLIVKKTGTEHSGARKVGKLLNGVLIKEYPFIKEAAKDGYLRGSISRAATTGIKHKGYNWKYLD